MSSVDSEALGSIETPNFRHINLAEALSEHTKKHDSFSGSGSFKMGETAKAGKLAPNCGPMKPISEKSSEDACPPKVKCLLANDDSFLLCSYSEIL